MSNHTAAVTAVRWGGAGLLYSASRDCTINVWAAADGKLVRSLRGHGHWVNTMSLSTDYALRTGAYDHTGAAPADPKLAKQVRTLWQCRAPLCRSPVGAAPGTISHQPARTPPPSHPFPSTLPAGGSGAVPGCPGRPRGAAGHRQRRLHALPVGARSQQDTAGAHDRPHAAGQPGQGRARRLGLMTGHMRLVSQVRAGRDAWVSPLAGWLAGWLACWLRGPPPTSARHRGRLNSPPPQLHCTPLRLTKLKLSLRAGALLSRWPMAAQRLV